MKTLWQNLRYAFRVLRKNPSLTLVAVLSLALGIGANTAIFTLMNALLLRNLPVRQPERLVEVSLIRLDSKAPFSYRMFQELERGQRVFSGFIGVDLGYQWHAGKMLNVDVNGVLSQNHLLCVTGNFYSERERRVVRIGELVENKSEQRSRKLSGGRLPYGGGRQ
jgi:hypothetical protein